MKSDLGTLFRKIAPTQAGNQTERGITCRPHARGQTHVQLVHIIAIRIDLLFPSITTYNFTILRFDFDALPNTENTHTCTRPHTRGRMKGGRVREFVSAIFLNEVVNETKEANEYEKAGPPGRGVAHHYLGSGCALLVPACAADQSHQQDRRVCHQYTRKGDSVAAACLGHGREVAGRHVDDINSARTFS